MADTDTMAQLAAQLQQMQTTVYNLVDQLYAVETGAATGGPNGDGKYPVLTRSGDTVLVSSPAAIAALRVENNQAVILPVFADNAVVSAGVGLARFRSPFPLRLTAVRGSLSAASMASAPAGSVVVDVLVNGVSIFAVPTGTPARLTIMAGQLSSLGGGAAQPVITAPDIPDDAEITVSVLGYGVGAKGLKVTLIGTQPA